MKYDVVIFDIEVFPKWWCIVYTDPSDITIKHVITSETPDYISIIRNLIIKRCLVGFNIKGYDLRILNAILHNCDTYRLYELSKAIINDDTSDAFNNYSFWNKFVFTDLFDDWRFGSLKEFESNIGMSIEESEISFDKENLTTEDKQLTIRYCMHDVDATVKLFNFRKEYIDSKIMLSEMFKLSLCSTLKSTNAKLCATVLEAEQKFRPEDLNFIIPNRVKEYITNNLPAEIIHLFDILSEESKNVNLFENNVVFGVGGIHSVCSDNIIAKTDDEYVLKNYDVTSYYPNLMMGFNYLSRNCKTPELFRKIYNQRVELKHQAKEEEKKNGKSDLWRTLNSQQTALKLILNTTYGAMKNKYNDLYDPYQASSLCYLGQLLLASLCNKVYNTVPGLKVIQLGKIG